MIIYEARGKNMSERYKVILDTFEGPLDLLLHLIHQLEIDIYDIPVAEITNQYMTYIHTMQELDLNVASEYLVMAATLLEMKSTMLLPKKEIEEEYEEYEEDPRDELVNQLVEYKKYKDAALQLEELELEENQIYTRESMTFEQSSQKEVERGPLSIYDMLQAYQSILKRQSFYQPLETKIQEKTVSVEERMNDIQEYLKDQKQSVAFHRLVASPSRSMIVATFLAVLHMLKVKSIHCKQDAQFGDILVSWIGEYK